MHACQSTCRLIGKFLDKLDKKRRIWFHAMAKYLAFSHFRLSIFALGRRNFALLLIFNSILSNLALSHLRLIGESAKERTAQTGHNNEIHLNYMYILH